MDFRQLPSLKEKWCYVIKNMWRMTETEIPKEDKPFRELYEECKLSKLTAMEKKAYKKSVLEYADVQDAIRCAQQNSLEEGIEQGREEGMQQGEAHARRLLARNMLAKGLAPALISEISGLTEAEVLALTTE